MNGKDQIKIGSTSFKTEVLKGITLTQAYERFDYLRKDIVKKAHQIANPKKRSKKKSSE